jgi:hypothetical protein
MRMLILILMQMLMLLLVLMLMPILIAEKFTCTISLNKKMDWYNTRCSIENEHTLSLAGVAASFMIVCCCIYAWRYPKTSMSVGTLLPPDLNSDHASPLPQTLVPW